MRNNPCCSFSDECTVKHKCFAIRLYVKTIWKNQIFFLNQWTTALFWTLRNPSFPEECRFWNCATEFTSWTQAHTDVDMCTHARTQRHKLTHTREAQSKHKLWVTLSLLHTLNLQLLFFSLRSFPAKAIFNQKGEGLIQKLSQGCQSVSLDSKCIRRTNPGLDWQRPSLLKVLPWFACWKDCYFHSLIQELF